ncbi:MAG TPA: class I SAM-dependent methyltransferase [Vicinamibacterales bacterium]|nr:class I SAM-dependent methyltransferase [Vicinamibacterales bacterium]
MIDPLANSAWSRPDTVAGFVASPPNPTLMRFAGEEIARARGRRALDLGCGAARNAVPLALQGWTVLGLDLSRPMLKAARERQRAELDEEHHLGLALAPMDRLPVADGCCDLVIAHGIWNLAKSSMEFRQAVREAARVSADGAALFVFTFSRNTLPPSAVPVGGESFVFIEFSGEPQCFLTEEQLKSELRAAGFVRDDSVPFRELNRPRPDQLTACRAPVIYEGLFRRVTASVQERL